MRIGALGFGLVILALTLGGAASAEFFNCNQKPGQLLYSYSGTPGQYSGRRSYSSRTTSDYSAQSRPRYQSHATYSSSRHYWNDRSRW